MSSAGAEPDRLVLLASSSIGPHDCLEPDDTLAGSEVSRVPSDSGGREPLLNLAVLLPDGVGVRNFVLGRFLHEATRRARIDILHVVPDELLRTYESVTALNGAIRWHPLERDTGGRVLEFARKALGYAHMYWADTGLMRLRLRGPIEGRTWRRRALNRAARWLGRATACRGGIALLDRCHRELAGRAQAVAHYKKLFRSIRPTVLFSSHQRPAEVVAPVLAARSLGIPTATFIFSWDNLTSKGRVAAPFDHFLVWSDLMKRELLRFYPDVAAKRVHIVGTPQFEPYADRSMLWSRHDFFRLVGGDPTRPLICYTGGDVGTVPEDPSFVRLLLDQIRSGIIRGNPQVLVRPSPVDPGTRYDGVRHDYPELLFALPAWVRPVGGSWADVIPMSTDVPFLANLTHHSDLNVNWASTVTLDFSVHDKPVVNVAFDVEGRSRQGIPAPERVAAADHYRPVIEFGAARIARSPSDLATHVNAYLAHPELDRDGRRRLVELEVGWALGDSSRRIVDVLGQIAVGER